MTKTLFICGNRIVAFSDCFRFNILRLSLINLGEETDFLISNLGGMVFDFG